MGNDKDNALIIDGLEFVPAGVEQVWVDLGIKTDPDGPEMGVLVNLIPVRHYKRIIKRNQKKKDKLGAGASEKVDQALDDELENELSDTLVADVRGWTIGNVMSILRANKKFGGDKLDALRKSGFEFPFNASIKNAQGQPILLRRYVYANAFPSKYANLITNKVTEEGSSEEDDAEAGKLDSED